MRVSGRYKTTIIYYSNWKLVSYKFWSFFILKLLAKKQRHNMVHVEVWAGDGEKTIGARWQKGK